MRKTLVVALLLTVAACGGDKVTGTKEFTGSYSLRTVNGGGLPAVVFLDDTEKDEVTGGTINLASDNTWSGTLGIRATDVTDGTVFLDFPAFPIAGTYSVSGSSITIDDPSHGLTFTGTVGGGELAIGTDLVGLGTITALVYHK